MIDIQKVFEALNQGDSFQKIKDDESPISIFCGLREKNMPSIAFLTQKPPLMIESTQYLHVSQWGEKSNAYWSSFDLQLLNARTIFYSLCLDLISAAEGTDSDDEAMIAIKNRYMVWRKMFRRATNPMSIEEYQGLFGELYFLLYKLEPGLGVENAVKAWSGAGKTSKDFSYDLNWHEIKTVSVNAQEVKISSLTQLEDKNEGHLVVIKVEKMSDEFDNGQATVNQLISHIMRKIVDIQIRDLFMEKVTLYGYSADIDEHNYPKYKVNTVNSYIVKEGFPRITSQNVMFTEIQKVTYTISLNGIKDFQEGLNGNN